MTRRVWVYLDRSDVEFLEKLGTLIGETTLSGTIKFAIKLVRMIVPSPDLIPSVTLKVGNVGNVEDKGSKVRGWVYLTEDDYEYIEIVKLVIGEHKISSTIRFLIKLLRIILPNLPNVVKEVKEELK